MKPGPLLVVLLSTWFAGCAAAGIQETGTEAMTPADSRPPAAGPRSTDLPPLAAARTLSRRRTAEGSVLSFLAATRERDLAVMGELFGTRAGSITNRDGDRDAQVRMEAMASILTFESWHVVGSEEVAGELGGAVRFLIDLERETGTVNAVPFVAVLGVDRRWYVREVDLALVIAGRS